MISSLTFSPTNPLIHTQKVRPAGDFVHVLVGGGSCAHNNYVTLCVTGTRKLFTNCYLLSLYASYPCICDLSVNYEQIKCF